MPKKRTKKLVTYSSFMFCRITSSEMLFCSHIFYMLVHFIDNFSYPCIYFRFRDDLAAFDEVEMTEETLQVVEPYIKRPHFGSGFMEKKTSNIALESLVSWVRGVVK